MKVHYAGEVSPAMAGTNKSKSPDKVSLLEESVYTTRPIHSRVFLFNLTDTASFNLVFLLYKDKFGPLLIIINLIAATMLYNVNK